VDKLLRAIDRLDYPPEKLDIILAVEADDPETYGAIEARTSKRPLSVIVVPPGGPRTKPKALNVALAFARGAYTVVYDAEDQPEPDQLRRALAAFATAGDRLACVQARLSIDNTEDSLLTRGIVAQTPQAIQPHTITFGIDGPRPGDSCRGPEDRSMRRAGRGCRNPGMSCTVNYRAVSGPGNNKLPWLSRHMSRLPPKRATATRSRP
jgi:hypothetical protein